MLKKSKLGLITFLVFTILSSSFLAAQVREPEILIVSGRPSDDIGIPGDNLAFMYNFSLSPNGTWWVGEFELGNTVDSITLRGRGNQAPDVVWAEHDPVPGFPGETLRAVFDDRQAAIDDLGRVVGVARRNNSGMVLPLVYKYSENQFTVVATQEMDVPALPFLYGDEFHSPNILADGTASFVAEDLLDAPIIENQISLYEDGGLIGQQKGVNVYLMETFSDFNDERFFTNPNGFFLFDGNTDGAAASNEIVVFGEIGTAGDVVLKEDTSLITLPNGSVEAFDRADQVFLAANNDWYVLGDTNGSGFATEVAIRNGVVLNAEGETAPDGFLYEQPIALTGDEHGNFAWIWETSNPDLDSDTVLVYNGDQILLAEGDTIMVDHDNDGVDEPAVIEFLNLDARNLAIGGGYVYLMVEIDQPDTTFIGNAFIRIPVFNVGDINRDGLVNLLDVQPFVSLLSSGEFQIEADTNGDGLVDLLDVAPFVNLLAGA